MSALTIIITNNLRLKDVPPDLRKILIEKLEIVNPKWLENERMGRWNRGTPQVLRFYDKVGPAGLWVPRGFMRQLILLCRKHDIDYLIDDQRRSFCPAEIKFQGSLRPFQQKAVDQMLVRDFGTL